MAPLYRIKTKSIVKVSMEMPPFIIEAINERIARKKVFDYVQNLLDTNHNGIVDRIINKRNVEGVSCAPSFVEHDVKEYNEEDKVIEG